jgi:stage V sporulation protein B
MHLKDANPPDQASALPPSKPLAPDVLLTLANKVGVLLLNVAGTVVVTRTLGPSGRGAIAIAISFALLLIQFGTFGLQSANPFFVARDPRNLSRAVVNSVWLALMLGLLLAGAGAMVKVAFPATLRGLDWLDMAIVLCGVPPLLASILLQSLLLATGRMVAYNGVELTVAALVFLGLLVGLAVFDIGVTGAIAVMVGFNIVACLCYLILLRGEVSQVMRPDQDLMARMFRYGFRIYITAVLAYAVGRINLLLVNSYLGTSAAGQYSIGIAIAESMHLLPSVVAQNLFPRVARGEHHGQTATVFRSLALLYALLCLLTVPVVGPGIQLLYGHAFAPAATIYLWLLPGIFAYGMLNVLSYHFAGRGFPLEAMLIWIPGLVINLAIVTIFLSTGGVHIAALAASVSYTVILLMHMRLFAKESGGYRSLLPHPRETLGLSLDIWRSLSFRG